MLASPAARALAAIGRPLPAEPTGRILELRESAALGCEPPPANASARARSSCNLLRPPYYCLFNVALDPCELHDRAAEEPQRTAELLRRLAEWNATAVPPGNLPLDARANPVLWNGTWTNFGDFVEPVECR